MKFFEHFTSGTCAGSGNQCACFCENADEIRVGRVYYRPFAAGTFRWSLLYSNTVDTTYADGSISRKNRVCDEWHIHSLKMGVCENAAMDYAAEPESFFGITIGGRAEADVLPGTLFSTDPVEITVPEGAYLCVELAFSGSLTPCFPEAIIPCFIRKDGVWSASTDFPFPSMVACDRQVKTRIGFLGDSITEGIGTEDNSYNHWNAVAAELVGKENAYWNLGIGYARAYDAAADGMWLFKARQNDLTVVCLGTNDVLSQVKAEALKKDLTVIVRELKKAGCKVIVQTIPPFDYPEALIPEWQETNRYIMEELSRNADAVFDVVPVLMGEKPHMAGYGGHPNAEGCRKWGEALAPVIRKVLEEK